MCKLQNAESSKIFKDLRSEDEDKDLGSKDEDKGLRSEDEDKDLVLEGEDFRWGIQLCIELIEHRVSAGIITILSYFY